MNPYAIAVRTLAGNSPGRGRLKPFRTCAVIAVVALWADTRLNPVLAEDAPATSGPTCDYGESGDSEQSALSEAVFMRLCEQLKGALVNAHNPRIYPQRLTLPDKMIAGSPTDFISNGAMIHGRWKVLVAYIVEADGRVTWATTLKTSGLRGVDFAATQWLRSTTYGSPARLDHTPVRMYSSMFVSFNLQ
jgi:hypothetical protein